MGEPPKADAVAREIALNVSVLVDSPNTDDLINYLRDALTIFAAQQVQATWEEAAQYVEGLRGDEIIFNIIWNNIAAEFRRRAQEGQG